MSTLPRPGEVVFVGAAASAQFAGGAGFRFRVIRIDPRTTYFGWCWLEGYQLDRHGDAVARRTLFVQPAGLRPDPPG